jgi:hypothetical protein
MSPLSGRGCDIDTKLSNHQCKGNGYLRIINSIPFPLPKTVFVGCGGAFPALEKQRKEDREFEDSLGYMRHCLKKIK